MSTKIVPEEFDTDCEMSISGFTAVCASGHSSYRPYRCHKCRGCLNFYRARFISKAMRRYDHNFLWQGFDLLEEAILWTVGTNLDDNRHNMEILRDYWRRFSKRMSKLKLTGKIYWKPLLRVYEAGSKGGKLHIHYVVQHTGFKLDHGIVLDEWRKITGNNANVNFSRPKVCKTCGKINSSNKGYQADFCKRCRAPMFKKTSYSRLSGRKAILYISKYLGKDRKGYYWMGVFKGVPDHPNIPLCRERIRKPSLVDIEMVVRQSSDTECRQRILYYVHSGKNEDTERILQPNYLKYDYSDKAPLETYFSGHMVKIEQSKRNLQKRFLKYLGWTVGLGIAQATIQYLDKCEKIKIKF